MKRELKGKGTATAYTHEYSDSVLSDALLISSDASARDKLLKVKAARAEAEKRREEAEVVATMVIDELFAEAEADRSKARQEIEDATAARMEIEKRCQQLEAEAREVAEKVIQEALQQAEKKASEIKLRAEAEARSLLVAAATIHATAQEELETQRILADAARIQTRAARLKEWARDKESSQAQDMNSPDDDHGKSNGHRDSENGLVKATSRRSSKKS